MFSINREVVIHLLSVSDAAMDASEPVDLFILPGNSFYPETLLLKTYSAIGFNFVLTLFFSLSLFFQGLHLTNLEDVWDVVGGEFALCTFYI